jgi:hypothetical protein
MGFEGLITEPDFNATYTHGSCATKITLKAALVPFPFRTIRSTVLRSGSSKGTCALIWPGETYCKGAGMPPRNTCVPLKDVGSGKLAAVVVLARLLPRTLIRDPRAAVGKPEAGLPEAAPAIVKTEGAWA